LQGAADTVDLTISDLLEAHGLSLDDPKPATKRQRIRKVAP
jgi:hypothetical protein